MTSVPERAEPYAPTAPPPYQRPVPGTVRLMTEEPLQLTDPDHAGLRERLAELVNRRPWIVPAGLLALAAAYFLLRRRR